MTLTFIGYRGSGKSAVGSAVAERLGRPFVDTDLEIERREGRSIASIFTSDGEAYFRRIEEQIVGDCLADKDRILATGGGAVLSPRTRERLKASGPVVYLKVTPETAEKRIATDATTASRRPALTSLPSRVEIETLMSQREPFYRECASLIVDADEKTVAELVEMIIESLPQLRRPEAAT